MKHIITALVENQPGVLARIVGLISGRGFNIESLCVAPTHDPSVSRITMGVPGDDRVLEQVTKQLNKLVDVINVSDLTRAPLINRELVLFRLCTNRRTRPAIIALAKAYGATILLNKPKSLVLQFVGAEKENTELLELLKPYQIEDLSRTGVIAITKVGTSDHNAD